MSENNSRQYVAAVANWLRLIQADLANLAPKQRRERLARELAGVTKDMESERRDRLLAELEQQFPTWGEVIVPEPPGPNDAPPGAWTDPAALVKRLQQLSDLNEASRKQVQELLRSHSLGTLFPEQQEREVKQALGVPERAALVAARVLDVVRSLAEGLAFTEQRVRDFWSSMGRQGDLLGVRRIHEIARAYLVMDDRDNARGTTHAELRDAVAKLCERMTHMSELPKSFGEDMSEQFAPQRLAVPTGFGRAKKSWRRFVALCGGGTTVDFQALVHEQFRRSLDRLLRRSRPAPHRNPQEHQHKTPGTAPQNGAPSQLTPFAR